RTRGAATVECDVVPNRAPTPADPLTSPALLLPPGAAPSPELRAWAGESLPPRPSTREPAPPLPRLPGGGTAGEQRVGAFAGWFPYAYAYAYACPCPAVHSRTRPGHIAPGYGIGAGEMTGTGSGRGALAPAPALALAALHHEPRLAAPVEFPREQPVRVRRVVQREAVRDDLARLHAPRLDVLQQVRHVAVHVALPHPQREVLVHRGADRHQVPRRAVHADQHHVAA